MADRLARNFLASAETDDIAHLGDGENGRSSFRVSQKCGIFRYKLGHPENVG